MKRIGSRAQVYHGNAIQTSGGLKKKDLFKDKHGCIKSKKASARARKNKNLGGLLKQKGSGCFDYHKTVKKQFGGGKNKKNIELEEHVFIFSNGIPTFTLPDKYKNAKLNYKCNCPLSKLVKHSLKDHVEDKDNVMIEDKEMGFLFGNHCPFNKKELDKKCDCGLKKEHKIKDHKKDKKKKSKKSKKQSGGKFGALFGKLASKAKTLAPAMKTMASKGTALAQKAAVKAKNIDLDKTIGAIEKGVTRAEQLATGAQLVADAATMGTQQLGQAANQLTQAGQQVTGSVGQLGHQVMAMPQQIAQPLMQPQMVQQQPMMRQPMMMRSPMMMMPRGGKKKKSPKSKKHKKSKK